MMVRKQMECLSAGIVHVYDLVSPRRNLAMQVLVGSRVVYTVLLTLWTPLISTLIRLPK